MRPKIERKETDLVYNFCNTETFFIKKGKAILNLNKGIGQWKKKMFSLTQVYSQSHIIIHIIKSLETLTITTAQTTSCPPHPRREGTQYSRLY